MRGGITVHLRHLDIHQNQIIIALRGSREFFNTLEPVADRVYDGSGGCEKHLRNFTVQLIVVCQQKCFSCKIKALLLYILSLIRVLIQQIFFQTGGKSGAKERFLQKTTDSCGFCRRFYV